MEDNNKEIQMLLKVLQEKQENLEKQQEEVNNQLDKITTAYKYNAQALQESKEYKGYQQDLEKISKELQETREEYTIVQENNDSKSNLESEKEQLSSRKQKLYEEKKQSEEALKKVQGKYILKEGNFEKTVEETEIENDLLSINKEIIDVEEKLGKNSQQVDKYNEYINQKIQKYHIAEKIEQAEREEAERKAREQAAKEEAERRAREQAKREEAERKAREQAEREEAERRAREQEAREEAERKAKEQAEKEEAERKAREQAEKEEAKRKAREQEEKGKTERKEEGLGRQRSDSKQDVEKITIDGKTRTAVIQYKNGQIDYINNIEEKRDIKETLKILGADDYLEDDDAWEIYKKMTNGEKLSLSDRKLIRQYYSRLSPIVIQALKNNSKQLDKYLWAFDEKDEGIMPIQLEYINFTEDTRDWKWISKDLKTMKKEIFAHKDIADHDLDTRTITEKIKDFFVKIVQDRKIKRLDKASKQQEKDMQKVKKQPISEQGKSLRDRKDIDMKGKIPFSKQKEFSTKFQEQEQQEMQHVKGEVVEKTPLDTAKYKKKEDKEEIID